ncbi:hypothetical protein Adt_34785 [Abeliophyllum distichum]|uniref:Uncharacterized protein n=1 Tax=Abeliophyllum distichum TaxID=126358 RepID=A0ABD1R037_9LAMI
MHPCYPSWTEVLEEQRTKLHSIIEEPSAKNNANRGKAKYPSVQGSNSFSATHYDQLCRIEMTIKRLTTILEQRLLEDVPDDDEEVGEDENDGGVLKIHSI